MQTWPFPDFTSTWLHLFLRGHCCLSITPAFHIRVHRIWIESSYPVVQWNLPSIFLPQTSSLTYLWSTCWTLSTSIDCFLVFPLRSSIKLWHLNLLLTWHPLRVLPVVIAQLFSCLWSEGATSPGPELAVGLHKPEGGAVGILRMRQQSTWLLFLAHWPAAIASVTK